MVVKNKLDNPQLNCTPITILRDYMKIEYILVLNNNNLIKEVEFLKQG
jgi:hypothetical protein